MSIKPIHAVATKVTTNSLLNKQVTLLTNLIAEIQTLQPLPVAASINFVLIHNSLIQLNVRVKLIVNLIGGWNDIMRDVGKFSRDGDHSIVLDGAPGVEMHGRLTLKRAHHVCDFGLPGFCEVKSERAKFQITKVKSYYKPLTGGSEAIV